MRRSASLVLLLAFLLAGCAGDGGKDAGDLALKDVETTATTGGISGVVVDQAIRPLAGARVELLNQDPNATTDADGLFTFGDLEPGFYTLDVAPPVGFLPVQTTAQVEAGAVAPVRVQLSPDLTPQPYHLTQSFEWFDSVGVVLVDFAVDLVDRGFLNDTLPDSCDRCYFFFSTDQVPTGIVVEAVWEDTLAPPDGPSEWYWVLDSLDEGGYEDGYCNTPCLAHVPMGEFGNTTNYGIGFSGDEEWVTNNQRAQVFVTTWYVAPPPEDWSFVAGDP